MGMPPPMPSAPMNRSTESSTRFEASGSATVKTPNTNTAIRIDFRRPIWSASMEKATDPIIQPKMLMSNTGVINSGLIPQSLMMAGAA